MTNTAEGSYQTTPERTMQAYDALPKQVRAALANSIEDWVPQPVRTRFERRGARKAELVKMIAGWDRKELANRANQRARGIGVYKGNAPEPGAKSSARKKRATKGTKP